MISACWCPFSVSALLLSFILSLWTLLKPPKCVAGGVGVAGVLPSIPHFQFKFQIFLKEKL